MAYIMEVTIVLIISIRYFDIVQTLVDEEYNTSAVLDDFQFVFEEKF